MDKTFWVSTAPSLIREQMTKMEGNNMGKLFWPEDPTLRRGNFKKTPLLKYEAFVAKYGRVPYIDEYADVVFGEKTAYSKIQPGHLVIKNVMFNNPATIVFWGDGSKTVVKCSENETFDPEKGLAMAIVKKAYGNAGNYYNQIKKWLPSEPDSVTVYANDKPVFTATTEELEEQAIHGE